MPETEWLRAKALESEPVVLFVRGPLREKAQGWLMAPVLALEAVLAESPWAEPAVGAPGRARESAVAAFPRCWCQPVLARAGLAALFRHRRRMAEALVVARLVVGRLGAAS